MPSKASPAKEREARLDSIALVLARGSIQLAFDDLSTAQRDALRTTEVDVFEAPALDYWRAVVAAAKRRAR